MNEALRNPVVFSALCGFCAVLVIGLLIAATRICYDIEARSGRSFFKNGLPGFANVIPVAFNVGVARDAETQALRRRMNLYLCALLAGLVLFAMMMRWVGA